MKNVLCTLLIVCGLASFACIPQVYAGTDVGVQCSTTSCTVTPDSIPVFNESNIWPGYTVTQQMTVQNTSTETGSFGMAIREVIPVSLQPLAASDLPAHIFVEIHQGTAGGPLVYGGSTETLRNLFNLGEITLGVLNPGQTEQYFFKAVLDPTAGNELMNMSSIFDLDLGANFTPIVPPTPPSGPSNNNSSGGGGGGGGGTSTNARTTVCTDTAPRVAPTLFFRESSTADGQVTLGWSLVASADNYAVNFGIQPGVYIYGNNNIGNQTTYTVTGLTPNTQYFFQVIPLQGCAPGPRSNEINTNGNLLGAGTAVNAPGGFAANQVLGVQVEATGEGQPNGQGGSGGGEVLGEQACEPTWKQFLPILFLIIQVIITMAIYAIFKDPENKVKQVGAVVTLIVTAVLFYFLRDCNCGQFSIFALLCKWYLVVAVLLALFSQFINYALIEREPATEPVKK